MANSDSKNIRSISTEECILRLLAAGQRGYVGEDIQQIYQLWVGLNRTGKDKWNTCMEDALDENKRFLYHLLIKSFMIWDRVQDKKGAIGWSGEVPSGITLETEITNLIHAMELIWRIHIRDCQRESIEGTLHRVCASGDLNNISLEDSDLEKQISPLASDDEASQIDVT